MVTNTVALEEGGVLWLGRWAPQHQGQCTACYGIGLITFWRDDIQGNKSDHNEQDNQTTDHIECHLSQPQLNKYHQVTICDQGYPNT